MPAKKDIDYKYVEDKAARLWKQEDIAVACGFAPDYFSDLKNRDPLLVAAIQRGKARAKGDIANAQYEVGVVNKNPQMLIHLGKHYLGQKDEIKHIGDDLNPVRVSIDYKKLTTDDLRELERIARAAQSEPDKSRDSETQST